MAGSPSVTFIGINRTSVKINTRHCALFYVYYKKQYIIITCEKSRYPIKRSIADREECFNSKVFIVKTNKRAKKS
jgi:hypothetical protein